jgi:hypothetical protein
MKSLGKNLLRAVVLCGLLTTGLFAGPVHLELLLLVDVSGSVDASEYALQKTGYVNAFNDPGIQAAIAASPGGIAVAYAEWSSATQQALLVPWAHLTDAASSGAFAAAISGTSRAFSGLTASGTAINWGVGLFAANGFDGSFMTIDVSGDGAENDGANTFAAATAALNAGITVNGLAILGDGGLQAWYQNNIVTPGGGQLWVANNFGDFETAVTAKIGQEIIDPGPAIPEPSTIFMMAGGMAALVFFRRRYSRS